MILLSSSLVQVLSCFSSAVSSIVGILGIRAPLVCIGTFPMYPLRSRRLVSLFIELLLHMGGLLFHLNFARLLLIKTSSGIHVFHSLTESSYTVVLVMLLDSVLCSDWGARPYLISHLHLLA